MKLLSRKSVFIFLPILVALIITSLFFIKSDLRKKYSFCIENGSTPSEGGISFERFSPNLILEKCSLLRYSVLVDKEFYPHALYILGRANDKKGDYDEARRLYEKSGNLGYAFSYYNLGVIYDHGKGHEENNDRAIRYYTKAEKLGNEYAKYNLAWHHLFGDGIKINYKIAENKFKQIKSKYLLPEAKYYLGEIYKTKHNKREENERLALNFYWEAHNLGNLKATKKLATVFDGEEKHLKNFKNEEKAIELWRFLAEKNDNDAALKVAERINSGAIKPLYSNERFKLLDQAANRGSARAANKIAVPLYDAVKNAKGKEKTEYSKLALKYSEMAYHNFHNSPKYSEETYPMLLIGILSRIILIENHSGISTPNIEIKNSLKNIFHEKNSINIKKFMADFDCGGKLMPVEIYTIDWKYNYPNVNDQFEWYKNVRGCEVDKSVKDSFEQLYKLAEDNNVSFSKLAAAALEKSEKEKKAAEIVKRKQSVAAKNEDNDGLKNLIIGGAVAAGIIGFAMMALSNDGNSQSHDREWEEKAATASFSGN